jgi:hypothetical protein
VFCRIIRFKDGIISDCCLLGYDIKSSRKYIPRVGEKYCFCLQVRKADYVEYGGSRFQQIIGSFLNTTRCHRLTRNVKGDFSLPHHALCPIQPSSIKKCDRCNFKVILDLILVSKLTMLHYLTRFHGITTTYEQIFLSSCR